MSETSSQIRYDRNRNVLVMYCFSKVGFNRIQSIECFIEVNYPLQSLYVSHSVSESTLNYVQSLSMSARFQKCEAGVEINASGFRRIKESKVR